MDTKLLHFHMDALRNKEMVNLDVAASYLREMESCLVASPDAGNGADILCRSPLNARWLSCDTQKLRSKTADRPCLVMGSLAGVHSGWPHTADPTAISRYNRSFFLTSIISSDHKKRSLTVRIAHRNLILFLQVISWEPGFSGVRIHDTAPEGVQAGAGSFITSDYKPRQPITVSDPVGVLRFGRDVLLWDDTQVGLIHLPRRHNVANAEPGSAPISCESTLIASSTGGDTRVLCLRPHPLSSQHLCVLWSNGTLCLYHTGQKTTEAEQTLMVPATSVSFTFAECVGWGHCAVYIATVDGSLYSLCPVLPYNLAIPTSIALELMNTVCVMAEANLPQAKAAKDWMEAVRLTSAEEITK